MTDMADRPNAATIAREELDSAIRFLTADHRGKRVLFWMLEQCAIYEDAFAGENNATNYRLGLQAAGRRLISQLDSVDPRIYPQLLIDIATIREVDEAAAQSRADNLENDDDEIA